MSKHTQGQWKHSEDETGFTSNYGVGVYDEDGNSVCHVNLTRGVSSFGGVADIVEEGQANARLIAAAPTMLEALKDLLRDSDFDPSEPLTTEEVSRIAAAQGKAQAAIRLAEGGE
jgi:hypothetical protein